MNLNQVTVGSTDVAKSVSYYQNLGLQLIVLDLPKYARFLCPDGNATFSVHFQDSMQTNVGTYIYFEVHDLDSEVAKLQKKGIQFDVMPVMQTWLWKEAYLSDPDGNKLILFEAKENRINPPWRIKN